MAMPVDAWKVSIRNVPAIDKAQIIKWYENADNQSENPGRFLGLDEQTKRRFEFINKTLLGDNSDIKNDYDKVKEVLSDLKSYFNLLDSTSQKYELILFDLINQAYRENIDFVPTFDFKNQFPKFEAHFKTEKLESLNFGAFFRKPTATYSTINFICAFRQIVTKDVIEKLDKAAEIDDANKSASSSFVYQSELEFCYLSLIIKMIASAHSDDTLASIVDGSINTWLNNYPFRILNGKGDFTPDNFFISANAYIRKGVPNVKDRLKNYFAFFNRLKNTRTPAKVTIGSPVDFLDLYDGSNTYEEGTMKDEKPTKTMRSVYFREDFDYLNSLLIRGVNLNRKFWIDVDKMVVINNKKLGFYLLLANTIKGLDEFYNSIVNDLGLKNGFTQDMEDRMERYKTICETPDENLRVILKDFDSETEDEEEEEDAPEIIDIEVLTKMDYNKYLNKNIAYISKEIVTYKDDEYKMHIEYSPNSRIILKDDGTERSYNYCYGLNEDLCNVIAYHNLRININTSESSLKEPIFKATYNKSSTNKISEITGKLIKDVIDRKIRIYWVNFTLQNRLANATILTVKTQFDVINSDPVSIKNLCDIFIAHDNFYLISFDYGKLPDESKPIPKPQLRADTFQERMADIRKRQEKLQNETMAKYKQEIDNVILQGKQQIAFYEQALADARARELNASDAQRLAMAKIKAESIAAIAKLKEENDKKKAAADLLLKEAEAELERLKEIGRRLTEAREKARAEREAALEAERLKRVAAEKEAADANALDGDIEEHRNMIEGALKALKKQHGIFQKLKKEFLKKIAEIGKLQKKSFLESEKTEFEKASSEEEIEFSEMEKERNTLEGIHTEITKLKGADPPEKEAIKKKSEELLSAQQGGIRLLMTDEDVEELVEEWAVKIKKLEELNNAAKTYLESNPEILQLKGAAAEAAKAAKDALKAAAEAAAKAAADAAAAAKAAKKAADEQKARDEAAAVAPASSGLAASQSVRTVNAQLDDEEAQIQAALEAQAAEIEAKEAAALALEKYDETQNGIIKKAREKTKDGYILVNGFFYKIDYIILPEGQNPAPADSNKWKKVGDYYFKKFACEKGDTFPLGWKMKRGTKICEKP